MAKSKLNTEIASREAVLKIKNLMDILPDPDELMKKTGKGLKIYRDLMDDAHLSSCVVQRKSGVLALNHEIYQNDSDPSVYEMITGVFKDIKTFKLMSLMLNAVYYGMQVFEIIWEYDGSIWKPAQIKDKPLEWFFFNERNQLRLNVPGNKEGLELPEYKFLAAVNEGSYSNPYGERILRKCYWPVFFKKTDISLWLRFVEKYASPLSIGKLPRGSSTEERDDLLDALDNLISAGSAVIPDDSSVQMMTPAESSSTDTYTALAAFMNSEISKAILTQTLTTEVGDNGSYAAAKAHGAQLDNVTLSDSQLVADTFNTLIKWIIDVNRSGYSGTYPVFTLYKPQDVDLTLAQRDEILTRQGVKFTADYYRNNYNLKDDEFTLAPVNTVADQPPAGVFAAGERAAAIKTSVEDTHPTDRLLDGIPPQLMQLYMDKSLIPVFEAIEKGESFESLIRELGNVYPELDFKAQEELLTKLLFIQDINGRLKNA